jgi:hypothetical protein
MVRILVQYKRELPEFRRAAGYVATAPRPPMLKSMMLDRANALRAKLGLRAMTDAELFALPRLPRARKRRNGRGKRLEAR